MTVLHCSALNYLCTMHRYFVELGYKGTNYCGWQVQPNGIAVQQKLNDALSVLCKENIETTGCGRTDTGVHALQFFAHFDTSHHIVDREEFIYHLNALLPWDISIYTLIEVDEKCHARFDAIRRTYNYSVSLKKDPFSIDTSWYWRQKADMDKMNAAAALLLQHADFTCFAKKGGQQATNNCRIYSAQWSIKGDKIVFEISADRFLRGMVRAIVGTLIQLGTGKRTTEEFKAILQEGSRSDAGEAVPAHGLFLAEVLYPYIPPVQRTLFQYGYAGS